MKRTISHPMTERFYPIRKGVSGKALALGIEKKYSDLMFKTGSWGQQSKDRSRRRVDYFREYHRKRVERLRAEGKWTGSTSTGRYESISSSQDSVGLIGEKLAMLHFKDAVWIGGKFDFLWLGKKVDVKASVPRRQTQSKRMRWKFATARQKKIVDLYILFGLRGDRTLEAIYVIPEPIAPNYISIVIGASSKYDKYKIEISESQETKPEMR